MNANPLTAGLPAVHPGSVLRNTVIPALGIPKTKFAEALGISRQTLYGILEERMAVTANIALRLGKVCGNGPRIWLALQQDYDLRAAQSELADQIAALPTLKEAAA